VALERTNPEMDRLARRWAAEQLGDIRGQAVWDLYGGVGDTAVLLAERGAQVVSVDADEAAIDWARRRTTAIPVRFIAARAEDILPTLPLPQGVVVQPPQEGLHWNVTLRLTGAPVPHLAYVSCDPATLARDLNRLAAVYRLVAVRAFDVFPQTAGVQAVATLEAS
jgi:23S rRNA (uracil1939-C5)-methyltransferase